MIDVDIESSKRPQVISYLKQKYGEDRVIQVATFSTEKAKAAIQVAARGLGYDTDIAAYLSSMVQADRGISRTLHQTFYGDEDNDIPPNKTFVKEMTENYPDIWRVAQGIEGLKCGTSVHAGGVIFNDEPFTKSIALMKSPEGSIISCYDLHDAEDCGQLRPLNI